jgi:hypothetical protein
MAKPTPNVSTGGGQPGPTAPTAFRTQQAAQFGVDWRDFLMAKVGTSGEVNYPKHKAGEEHTMSSGPMSEEDIFSDRRSEGRRTDGR